MTTPTLEKFVTSATFIFETAHWVIALRPKQPTLGSLVLISKSNVETMAGLTADETQDLQVAFGKIQAMYDATLNPDKLNYLALMMVDPNPHFHVIPRYAAARAFDGKFFNDAAWPGVPDLKTTLDLTDMQMTRLAELFRQEVKE